MFASRPHWMATKPGNPARYTESEWQAIRMAGIRLAWIEPVQANNPACTLYNVFTAHVARPSDGYPDPRQDAVIYTGEFRECARLLDGLGYGFIEPLGLIEVVCDPFPSVRLSRKSRGTGIDANTGDFVEWIENGRHVVAFVRARYQDWLIAQSPESRGAVPIPDTEVDLTEQPETWPEGIDEECLGVFRAEYPAEV